MITSSSNSKIKRVRLLISQAKARKDQGVYIVEGLRLLNEALQADLVPELLLYTPELDQRGIDLVDAFQLQGVSNEEVAPDLLSSTSDTKNPQGLLAVFPLQAVPLPESPDFLLVVDEIRDPGNLGTLMRTALAAGADGLILSPGTADPFSPKVVRAGVGAHFRLPIVMATWPEIKDITKNLTLFIADMDQGKNLWESDLVKPLGIIIGGEAKGPGKSARELADQSIHIPMSGYTESLNVSAAGAVLLFEVHRQRNFSRS